MLINTPNERESGSRRYRILNPTQTEPPKLIVGCPWSHGQAWLTEKAHGLDKNLKPQLGAQEAATSEQADMPLSFPRPLRLNHRATASKARDSTETKRAVLDARIAASHKAAQTLDFKSFFDLDQTEPDPTPPQSPEYNTRDWTVVAADAELRAIKRRRFQDSDPTTQASPDYGSRYSEWL